MKVYIMYEGSYSFIGVAATLKSAIACLIRENWIGDIFDDETQRFIPIEQKLGSNWKDILLNMSIYEFNDCLREMFTIEEETVIKNEAYC